MPWAVAGSLLVLWALGLLSAYLVKGIAPTLLIGALLVVLLRSFQVRWASRGVPEAVRADEQTP